MEKKQGSIIAISAPSGTGKTTIVRRILKDIPDLKFSVSATTRKARENEIEGIHYFFISEEEFKKKIEAGEFIEWEKFYDYYYGTYKSQVDNAINYGETILLEVDVKGALSLKSIYPESVLVYIVPPSFDELVLRLKTRNTEDEEDLQKRIDRAKMELSLKDRFDFNIENRELKKAVLEIEQLIRKTISKEKN
ncbi:MAG TPA: guanylate kinase [Ignavibacteriaceae bacterium]|nr:guanylate kinase [Ignavibacteriaceae bacterium]